MLYTKFLRFNVYCFSTTNSEICFSPLHFPPGLVSPRYSPRPWQPVSITTLIPHMATMFTTTKSWQFSCWRKNLIYSHPLEAVREKEHRTQSHHRLRLNPWLTLLRGIWSLQRCC